MRTGLSQSAIRRPGPRLAAAALAVLIALGGVTVGGFLYINRVAAGIGRVPVMFGDAHHFHASRPSPAVPR